jgi:TolB protein
MTSKITIAACLLLAPVLLAFDRAPAPFDERPVMASPLDDQQATVQQQQADKLVITLGNTAVRPKVGIADFVVGGGPADLAAAGTTVADVLWADLDFEQEFYMIDRKASAGIPTAPTVDGLPLDRWRDLGADFVVHGTLRPAASGEFVVDLRIVTVHGATAGQLDLSKSYENCTLRNPRWCAHSIADDVHKEKRNLDGVARTKIAFTTDRDNRAAPGKQVKEIYIMDYDGANQRPVTAHRSLSMMPAWSADAVTLAYVSYFAGFPDIYLTNTDGRSPSRPARGGPNAQNYTPALSPDGTRLLFASSREATTGNWDVFMVNVDGSGLRNLTPGTPNSSESTPTWNPHGTQIAFTSTRTGTNQIWVSDVNGLNTRRLPADRHCDRPTWSLQNFIAFAYGPTNGPHDIAIYDLLTDRIQILTDGVGSNGSPAVSPNGRHVVFTTTRWGGSHLAVVSRKGGAPKRLTEIGNNTYPNWSGPPR